MSQAEVLTFLEKHPDTWFTTKAIAEALDKNESAIGSNLRKLRDWSYVDLNETVNKRNNRVYIWRLKK